MLYVRAERGGAKHPRTEADRGAGSLGGESCSSSCVSHVEWRSHRLEDMYTSELSARNIICQVEQAVEGS